MAMLVTYRMKMNTGNAIIDVGVFKDPPPSDVFKSFETKMNKIYPNFDVILAHDLEIYNPEEIADKCNVLAGLYSVKDKAAGKTLSMPKPELVLPAYVKKPRQISKEYMKTLLSSKKTLPTDWLMWYDIPVDPELDSVLSKDLVDDMNNYAQCDGIHCKNSM